ncbi:hypothetical protein T4E_10175 [Trichinella pseudospiralis]|uniref:Uncharacterized protein n=1 Tax=Trichinella pseudospiralis TaxID=6337 RepID=A0A0V0XVP3_TRIPS|nr:hypothetical protein T4E_10175 [Trichinella pseudospiralis]KRY92265.1 hypothetical protein T4D_11976 [Trichinella pseudospiralis]
MFLDDDPMAAETHLIWMIDNHFQYQVGDSHSQEHTHPRMHRAVRSYGVFLILVYLALNKIAIHSTEFC